VKTSRPVREEPGPRDHHGPDVMIMSAKKANPLLLREPHPSDREFGHPQSPEGKERPDYHSEQFIGYGHINGG
jgi:hypothetical protein